ncbi:MAG: hypothetical protein ACFFG0_13360 [Candidatus Thorarchaeota archaeon]
MSKISGLALIIALGALGLGIYQIALNLAPSGENHGIRNVWVDYHHGSENTFPTSQDIWVDDLLINFTINPGELVLFLFDTQATISYATSLYIHFSLDGVKLTGSGYPFRHVVDDQSNMMIPISFHLVSNTISPGDHNVSIIIHGTYAYNEISQSTLLVQTFV